MNETAMWTFDITFLHLISSLGRETFYHRLIRAQTAHIPVSLESDIMRIQKSLNKEDTKYLYRFVHLYITAVSNLTVRGCCGVIWLLPWLLSLKYWRTSQNLCLCSKEAIWLLRKKRDRQRSIVYVSYPFLLSISHRYCLRTGEE